MSQIPDRSTPTESRLARLERIRNLGRWLDEAIAIPGTTYRVGLDPLIGLIPGGGDTVGFLLSAFIIFESAQLGASKATLGRMALNILLEAVAGTVPVLGDIFDVTWKANKQNLRLLEEHVEIPQVSQKQNRGFAILLLLGLALAIAGLAFITILILHSLFQLLRMAN
jgi:Domain of unknown function (DUF4112)